MDERTFTSFRLNLRQRSDRRYFQLNTRNDPRGGSVASIQRHTRGNECSVHFESSILRVHYTPNHSHTACTLVLPVIIRTSVSKGGGGKCRGESSREEQTTSGNTCNDPVFDIGSGAFRCTSPSPVAFNLFHLHVPKQKIGSYRGSAIVAVCQSLSIVYPSPPPPKKKKMLSVNKHREYYELLYEIERVKI